MMSEAEMRKHRCCFTGHRPQKLQRPEEEIKEALKREIRRAIREGFRVFISGMAQGVDIWAAQIVLRFREEGHSIRLICASPFNGFEIRWSEVWQWQYKDVMEKADLVRFISRGYSRTCFQRRNQWMVDHSAKVIAVYNGEKGGTKNTIDYAFSQGIPVTTIIAKD